jgi:hypothetical protein
LPLVAEALLLLVAEIFCWKVEQAAPVDQSIYSQRLVAETHSALVVTFKWQLAPRWTVHLAQSPSKQALLQA